MRSTGIVAQLLLTLSFALGIANSNRWRPSGSRLYVTTAVHRSASLLAVAFLAVHILTAVVDPDAGVTPAAALLPIGPGLWLVAGALSLELVAAVVVTSLVRHRLPYRTWRAIHWAAYAAWPLALAHGLGMGSDDGTWWFGAANVLCIAVMAGVLTWRAFGPETPARA
jgi:sulfoxide reductase heme-binding subunit YedZ